MRNTTVLICTPKVLELVARSQPAVVIERAETSLLHENIWLLTLGGKGAGHVLALQLVFGSQPVSWSSEDTGELWWGRQRFSLSLLSST